MLEDFDREAIDLVLLDVRLPGENGIKLAGRLRERARVPIILLTGQAEQADRVMGLKIGADEYFTKPFSPRELLARVRAQLLCLSRLHNAEVCDRSAGCRFDAAIEVTY